MALNHINIDGKIFSFKEEHLYLGRKTIDRDICRENLLIFKKILDRNQVDFGLIYGTLLGAVRENNFIAHDEDVDTYIFAENKPDFLRLLWELERNGLSVVRYTGSLLSVMRNDDYLDIYFFEKAGLLNRACGGYLVRNEHFKSYETIPFLGTEFNVPHQYKKLLVRLYGKQWHIPVKNAHAQPTRLYLRFVSVLKRLLPHVLFNRIQKIYRFINPIDGSGKQ